MPDTEKSILYFGVGFIGALFIMKTIRALRPASAVSMSSNLNNLSKGGCSSCRNNSTPG